MTDDQKVRALMFIGLVSLIALMMLGLFGCASDASQTLTINEQINIPLVEYTPEFQAKAAAEMEEMLPACPTNQLDPDCSAIRTMIEDYGRLRAQHRATQ